jgi:hypothetical protein
VIVLYAYINRWGRSIPSLLAIALTQEPLPAKKNLPWKFGTQLLKICSEIEFSLLVEEKQRNKETKNIEKIRGRNVY